MDLTNQFLIAMPALMDPNFHRTVTFMCAHDEKGAMGIVINRPLDISLGDMLEHMDLSPVGDALGAQHAMPVYEGGPVQQERGFVIHEPTGNWDSVLKVGDGVGVATSRDILAAVAKGEGPKRSLVALGYAGWGAGQLEQEVRDNAWLNGPASSTILFDLPNADRWAAAARSLGVDPERLSGDAGHA